MLGRFLAQLPMSEERRICAAKPIKPVACTFGFETRPFEFAARPAGDIEVNPLQGRTQLRPVEVAVVVDPANARVHISARFGRDLSLL
jgi:hypothetical protein